VVPRLFARLATPDLLCLIRDPLGFQVTAFFRSDQRARIRSVQLGPEHAASAWSRCRTERRDPLAVLHQPNIRRTAGSDRRRQRARSTADHRRDGAANGVRPYWIRLRAGLFAQGIAFVLRIGQGGTFGVALGRWRGAYGLILADRRRLAHCVQAFAFLVLRRDRAACHVERKRGRVRYIQALDRAR